MVVVYRAPYYVTDLLPNSDAMFGSHATSSFATYSSSRETMPVSEAQRHASLEVIAAIKAVTSGSGAKKLERNLSEMFEELVDRESLPEYYEVRHKVFCCCHNTRLNSFEGHPRTALPQRNTRVTRKEWLLLQEHQRRVH